MDQSSTAWRSMLERAKLPEYAGSSGAYIHGFLGLGERVIRLYTALKCGSTCSRPQFSGRYDDVPAAIGCACSTARRLSSLLPLQCQHV